MSGHEGSSFDDFLNQERILNETQTKALANVIIARLYDLTDHANTLAEEKEKYELLLSDCLDILDHCSECLDGSAYSNTIKNFINFIHLEMDISPMSELIDRRDPLLSKHKHFLERRNRHYDKS